MSELLNLYHNSRRKRALDYIVALPLRIASYPVELCAAAYLEHILDEGGPYFQQERTIAGKNRFTIKKLRTMYNGDITDFETELSEKNPRIAGFGARVIRAARIDELPQLSQVLSGDMRLVSLRPLPDGVTEFHTGLATSDVYNKWKDAVYENDIRPGLTGVGQIMRIANDDWQDDTNDYLRAETDYITGANLRTDIGIIGRTALTVLTRATKTVFTRSHATAQVPETVTVS